MACCTFTEDASVHTQTAEECTEFMREANGPHGACANPDEHHVFTGDSPYPVAIELLTEALERLEQGHYSDGKDQTCDGCVRASAVRQERDALMKESK